MPVQSQKTVKRELTQDWMPCGDATASDEPKLKMIQTDYEVEDVWDCGVPDIPSTFCPGTQFPLTAPPVDEDVLPVYEAECPIDPSQPDNTDDKYGDKNDTDDKAVARPIANAPSTQNQSDEVLIATQKEDNLRGKWYILSTLGEGAYGDVKLVQDVHRKHLLAMKLIHLPPPEEADQRVNILNLLKRETLIHKNLRHKNIILFVATRERARCTYIFLEYACGGELYDRILPDCGVPRKKCHQWFLQLISAMEYLHARGVVHRDIKPENLLLSENDTIKLSDFGLATLFRDKGRVRKLFSRRGMPSYVAPEVYSQESFHATPLDVWSAGIVLVAMLTGQLPWDQATFDQEGYCMWKMGSLTLPPWTNVPTECIALLRKLLDVNPDTRATIPKILDDHWSKRGFTERAIDESGTGQVRRHDLKISSVPCPNLNVHSNRQNDSSVCSQPVRLTDLLLSQTQGFHSLTAQNPWARLCKRMTRFFITRGVGEVMDALKETVKQMHMSVAKTSAGSYTISGQDRLKGSLIMKVCFLRVDSKLLMDFRLSKGDGLEFKRIFAILREKLNNFIDEEEVEWNSKDAVDFYDQSARAISEGFD